MRIQLKYWYSTVLLDLFLAVFLAVYCSSLVVSVLHGSSNWSPAFLWISAVVFGVGALAAFATSISHIPWVMERHFRSRYNGSVDKLLADRRFDLARLKALRDRGPDGVTRATYMIWASTRVPVAVAEDAVSRL